MGKKEDSSEDQTHVSKDSFKVRLHVPFSVGCRSLKQRGRYFRDGHWSQKEKLKYVVFLSHFESVLSDPLKKKQLRVYEMMSDMIVTRNANQCRSHHQKMQKYNPNILDIIQTVADKYEPGNFRQITARYLLLVRGLLDNWDKYKRPTPSPVSLAPRRPKSTRIRQRQEEMVYQQPQQINMPRRESPQSAILPEPQDRNDQQAEQEPSPQATEVKPKVQEAQQPQLAFQPYPEDPAQNEEQAAQVLSPLQHIQLEVERFKKLKQWYMSNAELYYEHWKHQMNMSASCQKRIDTLYQNVAFFQQYVPQDPPFPPH